MLGVVIGESNMRVIVLIVSLLISFDALATMRCSTDSFGNTTYRDNRGNTIRSSADSFGNTTYRDNHGNRVRCSRDSFGNTTCR